MNKKPKVAIFSLTSCEGCQFVLLDLGRRFLDLLKRVELVEFRLVEGEPITTETFDVVFIEGSPITERNLKLLMEVRKKTKILVVLGNCAALGGIHEIKNYKDKEKTIRYIYKHIEGIANPDIKEIDNFVKVDFTIPGCPIDGEDFLKATNLLIKGKIPEIEQKPVCTQCPFWGTEECFLKKKEPCLGPITLAGCQAVCTRGGLFCLGCRGLLKNVKPQGFLKSLEKMKSKKEIEENLEIFGIRDDVEERIK